MSASVPGSGPAASMTRLSLPGSAARACTSNGTSLAVVETHQPEVTGVSVQPPAVAGSSPATGLGRQPILRLFRRRLLPQRLTGDLDPGSDAELGQDMGDVGLHGIARERRPVIARAWRRVPARPQPCSR